MKDDKPDLTCAGCRHFTRFGTENHGECRRYPPTVFPGGSVMYPPLKANRGACGEFAVVEKLSVKEKSRPTTVAEARR